MLATIPLKFDNSIQENIEIDPQESPQESNTSAQQWIYGQNLINLNKEIELSSSSPTMFYLRSFPIEIIDYLFSRHYAIDEQLFDFSTYKSIPKKTTEIELEVRFLGKGKTRFYFDEEQ